LTKLELTKTQISCYHHKLLLIIFWNKMPFFKLLDFQTTIVRFLISNQIANLLTKCSPTFSKGRDFILQLTIPSLITKRIQLNKVLRTSARPTCQLTSPVSLTQRNSTRNCARIDKKCGKAKCLTRFRKSGMMWM